MAQTSSAQQETSRFFRSRKSPSQLQCDEIAQLVTGSSSASPIDSPGSMSYTVSCPGPKQNHIVSFREQGAVLYEEMAKLAKHIHAHLVPESTYHGKVKGAEPPIFIYSMSYVRGASCIKFMPSSVELDPEEKAKQANLVKHLARYTSYKLRTIQRHLLTYSRCFADCWLQPLLVDRKTQVEQQEGIRQRLVRLAEESPSVLSNTVLSKLIDALPSLFSQDYPQILTHGGLSIANILVDENTFAITGIVDWSQAAAMPFGLDFDILLLATGFMARDGWHDYACKQFLQDTFWEELWAFSDIKGEERRVRIKDLAEAAGKIGAILRLSFWHNTDGTPPVEDAVQEGRMEQLRAWLSE